MHKLDIMELTLVAGGGFFCECVGPMGRTIDMAGLERASRNEVECRRLCCGWIGKRSSVIGYAATGVGHRMCSEFE